MADDKQIRLLEQLLVASLGMNGERIFDGSIRLNQVLNKLPYKLRYLKKQNKKMAKIVTLDLRRFVGVIKRYQKAVDDGKTKPLGFFKRRALNKFRMKFESSLKMLQ